ncbi:hypothetical protein [Polymorphobacter megasporae]|uniref:hypothetical protein n=1 Tax=Glacieibacterium megasporae TaxID=2835787 RepID=UPI001C1E37A7|nr:hypothetical protein [Polymorphobacter megasporae]UAJ12335.1 hypothetical protein KTC28_21180 [Polymorphobacter megasporae]
MRIQLMIAAIVAGLMPAAVLADDETPPVVNGQTYVQHQIVAAKARHPEIVAITVIGKREKGDGMLVLGSTADRTTVMTAVPAPAADAVTGSTVREAFNSNSGHRLGTIELVFTGAANAATAVAVQTELAKATLSAKNAADPWPFDSAFGPDTYAQTLATKTIAKHPELLVMMIHATPPAGKHNVIIGSNIGRFGKAADEDDLRVIDKGSTNLEVGGDNDRFETELPLNDAKGHRIGALGLVFPFKVGDDREAIHRKGLAIRDEVAAAIPSSAALFAPTK